MAPHNDFSNDFNNKKRSFSNYNNNNNEQQQQQSFQKPKYNNTQTYQPPTQHVANYTPEMKEYMTKHVISIKNGVFEKIAMSFADNNFQPDILSSITRQGYTEPTPIQAISWPLLTAGKDIVAVAQTGSGKTCGYLLPAIDRMILNKKNQKAAGNAVVSVKPSMIVLAPTRELAVQIQTEAVKFGVRSGIKNTCVYGGVPKNPQRESLRRGCDIIIATPGRLNDFLDAGELSLENVNYLVLDEADRMLDMGFEPQLRQIVAKLNHNTDRQTVMFTATWPKEVQGIARDFLKPGFIQVNVGGGGIDQKHVASKNIKQIIRCCSQGEKMQLLETCIKNDIEPNSKVIIFSHTKWGCEELTNYMKSKGYLAASIHGDKMQNEREQALRNFRSGKIPFLIATDVAARGLDINNVEAVINYDFPGNVESYVHRIGRTGRAGCTGTAISFFTADDKKNANELCKILTDSQQNIPAELSAYCFRAQRSGSSSFGNNGRGRYGGGGNGGGFRGGNGGGYGRKW